MSPNRLRLTAAAVVLVLAGSSLPARAEPAPGPASVPVAKGAPELAAMLAAFEKARCEAAIPLAPAASTDPAPPKSSHKKKTWIIVGVVLGAVAVVAIAGGGGGGGGGGY